MRIARKKRKKKKKKTLMSNLNLTFSCTLKEELDDEYLQTSHTHNHQTLDDAEVEDARLGAVHRAEIAVFPRAEVFLVAADGR